MAQYITLRNYSAGTVSLISRVAGLCYEEVMEWLRSGCEVVANNNSELIIQLEVDTAMLALPFRSNQANNVMKLLSSQRPPLLVDRVADA